MTAREVTYKDICFGLQYGGERLVHTFKAQGVRPGWSFAKSGRRVGRHEAEKFLASRNCISDPVALGATVQTYGWRD